MPRTKRQQAERRGRTAERVAALWLRCKGYRVLDRNVKYPQGEIDIVACRGACLVFVEVKYRRDLDAAKAAVSPTNWQRISRAAAAWAAPRLVYAGFDWRYDLIAIRPNRLPVHFHDFWRP